MADPSYINSQSINWDKFYQGMFPSAATPAANTPTTPTASQLAAMKAIPAGSYRSPPNVPINLPTVPFGSQYADTGNRGRATPNMMGDIQLNWPQGVPASPMEDALINAGVQPGVPWSQQPGAKGFDWMGYSRQLAQQAMRPPVGANPGMGGAMIGNGVMSPNIPPQGPPPAGIAPTQWQGDGLVGLLGNGGQPRGAQHHGGLLGLLQSSPRGAQRYALANLAGQQAAAQKRSTLSGVGRNDYTYVNGVNQGYAPAQQAARAAQGKAIGEANRKSANPTRNVSGSNNAFEPRSVQDSVRWQTGY